MLTRTRILNLSLSLSLSHSHTHILHTDCYCNTDDAECVNNSCELRGGHCLVELRRLDDGQYKLKYDCVPELLGCITTSEFGNCKIFNCNHPHSPPPLSFSMCIDPYRCCNGNNCNMCLLPEFDESNELLRRPAGLDVQALLPPECRDGGGNATPSPPPPTPSNDPNSTHSTPLPSPSPQAPNSFTFADITVDTTTQPGDFNGAWNQHDMQIHFAHFACC
jgi:hypothetical protein